ncbi:MAG: LLM class flavin-dependent oxidoreductase, partial [Acetobacteraceae bacterium]
FTDYRGTKGIWFEMWSLLSAVTMATTRIRLANLVAQIPLRNPALFALQALTADHISGGRLDIGLGIGLESDPSCQMMGVENWSAKERVARFGEYVEIVHRLLSQEETSYQGSYYKVDAAALCPRPVQSPRPPLIIAALGPVMLGHAARHADVWNTMSFAATYEAQIEETRKRVAAMNARCVAIGRDPSSLRRSFYMSSAGGSSPLYESEETVPRLARQLIALGITELVLFYPRLDRHVQTFERIAREVLPALRAAHAI